MGPLISTWRDYRDAAGAFSRPARLFLLSSLLVWAGFGVNQVLFNLYLVEAGFGEAFVGRAVSLNGLGLALAALPAGLLADRWGRRRSLMLGAVLDGVALLIRCMVVEPGLLLGASFLAGVGQSVLAIAAAPFLTEHSGARERTHLFSAFLATELLAAVVGNLLGGWLPAALRHLPDAARPDMFHAYRVTLVLGAAIQLVGVIPLMAMRGLREMSLSRERTTADRQATRRIWPIAINALCIGAGAGLVIPFMNLYFKSRFDCSSAQIGMFFSLAQVSTAFAALLGPAVAGRLGTLRTAIALQLLSLPFLVTLGAERNLEIAVVAFWFRATLMQASTPLLMAFIMEVLPPSLRSRASSFVNLLWNAGWAVSATSSGLLIQHYGYAVPFYVTATLYGSAAIGFYFAMRGTRPHPVEPPLPGEARGLRGEGPMTE